MQVDLNMIVFQRLLTVLVLRSLLSFLEGVSNKYFVDGARITWSVLIKGLVASINLKTLPQHIREFFHQEITSTSHSFQVICQALGQRRISISFS